jgi:hypothetical protein
MTLVTSCTGGRSFLILECMARFNDSLIKINLEVCFPMVWGLNMQLGRAISMSVSHLLYQTQTWLFLGVCFNDPMIVDQPEP